MNAGIISMWFGGVQTWVWISATGLVSIRGVRVAIVERRPNVAYGYRARLIDSEIWIDGGYPRSRRAALERLALYYPGWPLDYVERMGTHVD